MDSLPLRPTGTLLLPEIKVVSAENSRQLEKRFTFLWNAAHRLLATNTVLANHMIASMMQLVKINRAQLPQPVLDFICESCGGLLMPSMSADVRVVSQSHKSPANRRLARQQRRVQQQNGSSNTPRLVRETLSTIVRVTCHRCQHVTDRPGASKVHKVKTKKRNRDELQPVETLHETKKIKVSSAQISEKDQMKMTVSSRAEAKLQVLPSSIIIMSASASSPPRKLLDGPKKRKKKKKTVQLQDAAVVAVKNSLNSFLQGLNARK